MHSRFEVQDADRLRAPGRAGRHHGLGRHGGDGPGQLHGRRGAVFYRVHHQRILRPVHALPRGHRADVQYPAGRGGRRRVRTGSENARRPGAVHQGFRVMRSGTDGRQSRADDAEVFPGRVYPAHKGEALPGGRVRKPVCRVMRIVLPAAHEYSRLPGTAEGKQDRGRVRTDAARKSAARFAGQDLPFPLQDALQARHAGRVGFAGGNSPLPGGFDVQDGKGKGDLPPADQGKNAGDRQADSDRGRGPRGAGRGVLAVAAGARGHDPRGLGGGRGHPALGDSFLPAAQGCAAQGNRLYPEAGGAVRLQFENRDEGAVERAGRGCRRGDHRRGSGTRDAAEDSRRGHGGRAAGGRAVDADQRRP